MNETGKKFSLSEVSLVLGPGPVAYTLSADGVLVVYAREGLSAAPATALLSVVEEGYTTWVMCAKEPEA